ncbi:glycosyl transferase [Parathermosynechococcus lividus PCC 6715]|uniref:Glycosyl transferase n=1 Tax=Parathermosynechococcus lividus PCC 6715 TaxID=1917166 RepID=A0A2D2PZS1_PARLV|nr:glycosyltransferase [Thermostichus lividus]ATS17713.1 glycosyl transferase [Thermostichus lividus PCC 6715]
MTEKVSIFLPSLNGGGAERVMVTLANGFAARGYAVDLVLATAQGPYLKDVRPEVQIVNLRAGRVIKALLPLARHLRRTRPAALLSAMNHANVVAALAHRWSGVPSRLVLSEHNTISVVAQRERSVAGRIVYALVPWMYRWADSLTAVSQAAARDLEQFAHLPAGAVRAIYNPFDLQRIHRMAHNEPRHPWLAPGQPPVVLAIGRLTEQKNFSTLIRAFAQSRLRGNARLLILGEGPLRPALLAEAAACGLKEEDFQMPGFIDNPYAFLARAGVFVLSSRWEGLPGVLIEAMACGTPVVSTDCPSGPNEILEGGRWGRLVPVGDSAALANAIDAVLAAPRDSLPNVRLRAADFDQERAIDTYLAALGLPPVPGNPSRA